MKMTFTLNQIIKWNCIHWKVVTCHFFKCAGILIKIDHILNHKGNLK